MKRNYKLIIILGVLLLSITGCSIDYNLEIDSTNNFKEDFTINASVNSLNTMEDIYNDYLNEYPIYSDDYEKFMYYDPYKQNESYTYFKKSYQRLENGYKLNYKADFKFEDFNKARTLKMAFNTGGVGYLEDEDYYYISFSNPSSTITDSGIDNLNIKITFNNVEVISSNADNIKGKVHSWLVNKDTNINVKYKIKNSSNITQKPVTPDNDKKDENKKKENNMLDYILVGSVLLLFIIAIIGIIKYKSINKGE